MGKKIIALIGGILLGSSGLFAQGTSQTTQKEELVLTSYYPVPYGDYDRFMVNRMAVGDTNGDGKRTAADLPSEDGQLSVAKSVIYTPQGDTPKNWSAGTAGELAFSKDDGGFYYYNGSEWVAQSAGGGASYVAFGTQQCAASEGWKVAYTGYAMTVAIVDPSHTAGGGIVCKAGAPLRDYQTPWGVVWSTISNWAAASDVPCAVCVK